MVWCVEEAGKVDKASAGWQLLPSHNPCLHRTVCEAAEVSFKCD